MDLAKNKKLQHLKNLDYTLTIWNKKNETHKINIDGSQIILFGPELYGFSFVNYIKKTKNLPKKFTKPGLKKYTFTSKTKLKFNTEVRYDYSIDGRVPFAYVFTKKIKKGQKVSIAREILPGDAKSTTEINITLE